MNKFIFFVSLFYASEALSNINCEQGKIIIVHNKKKETQTKEICSEKKGKETLLFSRSCENLCKEYIKKAKFDKELIVFKNPEVGSPHFKLCYGLNGSPFLAKVILKNSTHRTMLCSFPNDTFVNTEALYDIVSRENKALLDI